MKIVPPGRRTGPLAPVQWLAAGVALVTLLLLGPLLVRQDRLQPADAMVVIGGDHKPERMRLAAALFDAGYAPIVVLSAGTPVMEGAEHVAEAEVMRRQALALGIPAAALLMEDSSRSTRQNALYTRSICRAHGWSSVLLVASTYHSRRAARIFRDVYAEQVTISVQPAPPGACTICWWYQPDQFRVVLYEYYNWGRYWLGRGL